MEDRAFHTAVIRGETEQVELAIANGIDLDKLDSFGNSPLHWAVMCVFLDIVEILLKAGANPNILCSQGYTPKWSALDFGLKEIADLLTSYGGKTNTGKYLDKTSWTVFKGMLGQELSKNKAQESTEEPGIPVSPKSMTFFPLFLSYLKTHLKHLTLRNV